MAEKELVMTFDPNTIEHLGIRMYSTLPPVLAELVANAYDADATYVALKLNDKDGKKEIIIEDDGLGMSFDEINDKFLRIGRNRRIEDKTQKTSKDRKIIGKKGLGKLSFFGIAHEIEITTKKDGRENTFAMSWEGIKKSKKDYKPETLKRDQKCQSDIHGTKITLRKIQRETDFSPENIANSLSKMFIIDPDFKITLQHNFESPISVNNERKYTDLEKEVEWEMPRDVQYVSDYEKAALISGQLIATKKPISPRTNMRGIVLFSRKKLVNQPEYFSDSTSSHFFSYLTGWLEVDFIDDLEEDVISTNRQSLNWGHPEMQKLKVYLQGLIRWLEQDWRKKRSEIREKKLSEVTGVNISDWFSKLPEDIRKKVEPIVQALVKDSELPDETHQEAVRNFHEIIPEYPKYHWRHLHSEIKAASEEDYKKQDYYRAFLEAAKRYINAVREKSGSANTSEASMMGEVFGEEKRVLLVAQNFKKSDGQEFQKNTISNIESGQKFLSIGVVSGCRNPVSHEEIQDLRESGLFSEKDCLDALSLLSHLFNRLDNAQKVKKS